MKKVTRINSRKADHLKINLAEDVHGSITTGLERIGLMHQALPGMDLDQVNTSLVLFNRKLSAPILISSMTGGTPEAGRLNLTLARAAQDCQIALGLGSFRVALDHPELAGTFKVRHVAPDILLLANLGAIQFNYSFTVEHALRTVQECNADALILHLNPLQEALQPEGQTSFSGLIKKIESLCRTLPVPVIVKEVGWGISVKTARLLAGAGVSAIDVAGAGGTSWSQVEMHRLEHPEHSEVAAAFRDWGIPTAQSIRLIHRSLPRMMILASGGLKDGIDIAKCIALGATAGGMAGPFLKAAAQSPDATIQKIDIIKQQLRIAMFSAGARDLDALARTSTIDINPIDR
ncbi:MAG: type 2 isopentenyl-diphosphate Delta-isomerase [Anaerolineaceae bacterium]|nr:type 2 isopentenyl-diphosphate Delta-isomerase [Anaerolineaceae bacterium]